MHSDSGEIAFGELLRQVHWMVYLVEHGLPGSYLRQLASESLKRYDGPYYRVGASSRMVLAFVG